MLVNALHISRSTGDEDLEDKAGETDLAGISDSDVMQTRPFNQRISLPTEEGLKELRKLMATTSKRLEKRRNSLALPSRRRPNSSQVQTNEGRRKGARKSGTEIGK